MKIAVALIAALLPSVACKKAGPPADPLPARLHAGLTGFFTPESDSTRRVVGLWVADRSSLERIAQKRGLLSGLATGEASRIRERLENLAMFFNVAANGSYRSMTIVKDSVALSYGRLSSRQLGDNEQLYEATIRGKADARATIRITGSGNSEKFIYQEGSDTIEARRETRTTAELLREYEPRITASAALPPG